jgi:predicted dehydrogenase
MTATRRSFLKSCGVATAAVAAPAVVRGRDLNGRLQIACVGVDGMGYTDIAATGTHPKVAFVGFCDIDGNRFARADAKYPGVPHFADYRQMFATLGDGYDAVLVDTPDHMHAPVAVAALQAGKHVYCQKPLSHTLWEARQMRLWAEAKGVTTQMGNQIHSNAEYRLATRLVRDGVIGKVQKVQSWVWLTGNERTKLLAPPPPAPVPPNVNWDLWIGAAPMRDYADAYHPFMWRDWQDFGCGSLGDFGCHILDPVFTALDLTTPHTVRAGNSGINDQIWPTQQTVTYVFPGTEFTVGKELEVTWMDGGLRPEHTLARMPGDKALPRSGSLFIGEEGCLVLPHVGMPQLYPVEKFASYQMPQAETLDHRHVWVDACLAGTRTSAGFHYAGPLSETVQLGNIATRLAVPLRNAKSGRLIEPEGVLEWDTERMAFRNSPQADRLITKPYRKGFEVAAAPPA